MRESALFFLCLTVGFLILQAYFSMMEMALVSFNRVRLQYYVSQGRKGAIWISKLLANPAILFGTTLIGVNSCLQIGSECARRFYVHMGVSPDFAPITQIILVVLFAELTPLFAARAHAEHVAMLGIRGLYVCSWLFSPVIWALQLLTKMVHRLLRCAPSLTSYLTREELQRAIEARVERSDAALHQELITISNNIFGLKTKTPIDLMIPLSEIPKFQENISIETLKEHLSRSFSPYIALYHDKPENILGMVFSRDLLRASTDMMVRDLVRSTWFVTEKNSIHQVLGQLRSTFQQLAIVLDEDGKAKGIITLDTIVNEIFHKSQEGPLKSKRQRIFVDRSFPAHTLIEEINRVCHLSLPVEEETLEGLLSKQLGHTPKKGESVQFKGFTFIIEDSPLMMEKSIRIKNC